MTVKTRVVSSFADVDAAAFDAVVGAQPLGANNPFVQHAFLLALERSGSIGKKTAWAPRVVVAEDAGGALCGAVPAFLRTDSFGEFIFDWQIAEAARKFGVRYYPKLTVAVPFTPATGPRLLSTSEATSTALLQALASLQKQEKASSTHVLFCSDKEAARFAGAGFTRRASLQFHWRNHGYGSFDDFLGALSHEERKQIRRERRRVKESGLVVEVKQGHEVPRAWWPKLYALYAGIYDRKWGRPYLTQRFFTDDIPQLLGDSAVIAVARDPQKSDVDGVVAMTLSFERGKHCYGRSWGTDVDVPGLHFELCYYALLERAIARGQTLVEAGAQGEHKLKRGYLPVITHSAHRFAAEDERGAEFGAAVARFFVNEAASVVAERDALAAHGPFKEGCAPPVPLVAGLE